MSDTSGPQDSEQAGGAAAGGGSSGGKWATIISAAAFMFSGFSFYESALKQAELEVYIPPVIHYGRDGGGEVELFAIPVTITNDGARTGTILSMDLEVEPVKSGATLTAKRYYSAYLGEHPRNADAIHRAFAPASIHGRATYSDTIRFYPAGNVRPHVIDDAGEYRFTLRLNLAEAANPGWLDRLLRPRTAPVEFRMTLPWFSEQQLGMRRQSIAMHAKDHRPTGAGAVAAPAK